jgi:hypothetical protein
MGMNFLRQNTAVVVTVGPFYDKTDGVTIETALTITNERITLIADTDDNLHPVVILDNLTGAASGTSNDLNYVQVPGSPSLNNSAGLMRLELTAANTNRVGRMRLSITDAANHVPVFETYFVLPQAIYDWLTGVIVPLPANVTTWNGSAVATPNVSGVPKVDVTHLLGTAWLTPGTAGTPDVNVKLWNGLTTVALPLVPTTAGRTLDVSTGGEAGLDWANIGSPTTAQNLSATNIDIDQVVASVSGAVGSVTGAVGSVTGNVTGSIGSLAAQAKADVNAEVVDALATDTYAEPAQGAPGATVSLASKIGFLYKNWRNKKTQTSTTFSLFNDDAATVDHKSTVSDDATTATRGEIATGP